MHAENGSKIDDIQRLALNGAIFDKLVVCKKERDELLAALKDMVDYFKWTDESEGQYEAVQRAKNAIGKVEI